MGKIILCEKAGSLVGGLKVDRKAGVIFGVKVLGHASLNGRLYLPEAVRQAAPKYEGVHVNIDHPDDKPTDQRSAYDRFGKLVRVRYIEGKGLYADLEYLVSHPMAGRVVEAAEKMPDLFGLSHNAEGEGDETEEGVFVINRIVEVRHVDLVADPATTRSLSEGVIAMSKIKSRVNEGDDYNMDNGGEEKPSLRDMLKDIMDGEGSSDYKLDKMEGLYEAMKEEFGKDQEKPMEEAEDGEEKPTAEQDDEEKSDMVEEGDGEDKPVSEEGDEEKMEGEDGEDDSKPMESIRRRKSTLREASDLSKQVRELRAQIEDSRKTELLREFCESKGIKPTKPLLADLKRLPRDLVERHVAALIAAQRVAKPKSGVPVMESASDKIPTGLSLGNFLTN
jgi:hypothetical protein